MPLPISLRALIGGLTILAVSSCGQDIVHAKTTNGEHKAPRQLQLEHIAGQPAPKPTKVLLDIPVDRDLELWKVTAGTKGLEARRDKNAGPGRFALHLLPRHAPIIEFDLDLDPSEFNLVQVVGSTRRHRSLKIELLEGSTVVHSSNVLPLPPMGNPQVVRFPIPKMEPMPTRITGMRLKVSKGSNRSSLLGVQIVDRSVADRLEGTPSNPQLIHFGAEARRGVGLSSKHPLIARLPEGFNGEMTFSFAPAPSDNPELERGRLKVQVLRAGILDQKQLFDFEPNDRFPRWSESTLSLIAPAGADTQVQFSLVDADEEEGLCALGLPELIWRREKPKTVLLITSDTHRADYLGASNSGVFVKTPYLDALAARGVLFEDCGSVTNVTNPSHISMLTGTPVRDTGIVDNATPVSEQAETLAEAFKKRGYLTYAAVSAGQLTQARSGLGQGFDRMSYPVRGMGTWDGERTIAFAESWLEDAQGRDLFLWLHFFDVHSPYDSPEDYYRPYYSADKDPYDKNLPELSENQIVPWDEEARDLAYIESRYRGEVTYLDELVGKFLEIDRIQSGVIGFTADHGEWLRGPEYFFAHATLSPSTLNVPLIIAWPNAPAGKRVEHPVQNIDIGRTLLDLAGEGAATFPGSTLFPEEAPEEGTPRFTIEMGGKAAGIRSGRWFLVLNLVGINATSWSAKREKHAYRLHDLSTDPICQVDLRAEHEQRAKKLRASLINWLQSGSKGRWAVDRDVSQTELDQLAQLGYSDALVGSSQSDWYEGDCPCQWCATAE